ncbi:MAG: dolichyl-phosphate beta-glucosyltransferase [Candidatus Methylomirabilales bacterium]
MGRDAKSQCSVSLILPAYNEVKRIAQTIGEARAYFEQRRYRFEIIVSADGDDGTRELVAEMARADPTLKVIGSVARRGKGHGIRQGVALAKGEVIGFADADNKTPIDEFDKFEPWLRGGYEVVIGSRALRESRIEQAQPLYRRLGSKVFRLFIHAVVGLHDIVDTQCGFKFFQRRAALDLFGRQRIDGGMFDVEVLYLAQHAGYRIAQVPIRWRYDGDSRLALLSANVQNVIDIFRIRFGDSQHLALLPTVDDVETKP